MITLQDVTEIALTVANDRDCRLIGCAVSDLLAFAREIERRTLEACLAVAHESERDGYSCEASKAISNMLNGGGK